MQIASLNSTTRNCRRRACGHGASHPLPPAPRILHPRPGITLIELLVTILIISILAGLVLGVAAVAAETAREAQSRHIVERLHTLLMEYYDTYKTRRVIVNSTVEQKINQTLSGGSRGQALAEARLYALREMMLMEVPDRWSDVLLNEIGTTGKGADDTTAPPPATSAKLPVYLADSAGQPLRTALANVYLRRYGSLVGRINTITGAVNTAGNIKANQSAECLYMVITLACGDGEAKTLFKQSDIGDTDGDGAPEFLDGWKHPISFLRWAPGFDSQIQLNLNSLNTLAKSNPTAANAEVAKDHDPFDLYRRDTLAFRLVPLIYSAGRDEELGIFDAPDVVAWPKSQQFSVANNPPNGPYLAPIINPYTTVTSGSTTAYLGTALDGTATDNVHNHLMGQR
ncbi:MAG TPA: type II secretion system protein [Lacipirellulaceae bacterium]|nr:type II secretion system protein [Lacipirellulaceae bacterium]